jgi:hypothetical protein
MKIQKLGKIVITIILAFFSICSMYMAIHGVMVNQDPQISSSVGLAGIGFLLLIGMINRRC